MEKQNANKTNKNHKKINKLRKCNFIKLLKKVMEKGCNCGESLAFVSKLKLKPYKLLYRNGLLYSGRQRYNTLDGKRNKRNQLETKHNFRLQLENSLHQTTAISNASILQHPGISGNEVDYILLEDAISKYSLIGHGPSRNNALMPTRSNGRVRARHSNQIASGAQYNANDHNPSTNRRSPFLQFVMHMIESAVGLLTSTNQMFQGVANDPGDHLPQLMPDYKAAGDGHHIYPERFQ